MFTFIWKNNWQILWVVRTQFCTATVLLQYRAQFRLNNFYSPFIQLIFRAYARRGDVIFADKGKFLTPLHYFRKILGVNFAIQKGIQASRSQVFKV